MALAVKTFADLITFARPSAGTRVNPSGLVELVAAGQPRFDYDPLTLACRGLLIEEQRTNLLTFSERADNAAWAKGGASVSPNLVVAPDGTVSADKLIEDAANSLHYLISGAAAATAGAYTASVFLKAAGRSRIRMHLRDAGAPNYVVAIFNLAAGTVDQAATVVGTGWSAPDAKIVPMGNGWYRCAVTGTNSGAVTSLNTWVRLDNGAGDSYLGDATSGVYIWGAQLEAGAFATSYIPTTSAQATRAADIANLDVLTPWYSPAEGTFVVAGDAQIPASAYPCLARVYQDANNFFTVGLVRGDDKKFGADAKAGGAWVVDLRGNAIAAGAVLKQALAYRANDWAVSNNGAAVLTDTSNSTISPVKLQLGYNYTADCINGHIRSVAYYPKRLPNAQLQALSA